MLSSLEIKTHGSLFTGFGIFDYAAMLAGIKTLWQVENNEFCLKLLKVRYPDAKRYKDIKTIKAEELARVNIISGGFPCQPHSIAGKGKGSEDERNLFPDMLRVIRKNKPEWVLGENVYGILNTDDGKFFEQEVITPLENEGYKVQPYIIPASAIGAVHRRDRIWIVANRTIERKRELAMERKQNKKDTYIIRKNKKFIVNSSVQRLQKPKEKRLDKPLSKTERGNLQIITDTEREGLERTISERNTFSGGCDTEYFNANWIEVAARLCRVDASSTSGLLKSGHRKQRLEGLGNGIQWEIAYIFFELIKSMEANG